MPKLWRWLVRVWRWRVEVRPVPNLLFYAGGCAAAMWLPDGAVRGVQAAMLGVIAVLGLVLAVLFGSGWRQGRKTRKARGDERLTRISTGHEPTEVITATSLETLRRLNAPGRKGPRR